MAARQYSSAHDYNIQVGSIMIVMLYIGYIIARAA